jgi:quercetin dioxygenase-like cupin family protein
VTGRRLTLAEPLAMISLAHETLARKYLVDGAATSRLEQRGGGRADRKQARRLSVVTERRSIVVSNTRFALTVAALLVPATAVGAYAAGAARDAAPQATRTILAQAVNPAGARGRTLALSRVTIPARTRLALHRHPGTQIAYIQRGTLTYTVKTGVVNVYRGAADQSPRIVRRVKAGHTGIVRTGEWVIERPSTIHFGANNGDKPLVILLATLFTNGSPPSIPVPG